MLINLIFWFCYSGLFVSATFFWALAIAGLEESWNGCFFTYTLVTFPYILVLVAPIYFMFYH